MLRRVPRLARSSAGLLRDEAWLSRYVRVNVPSLLCPIEPRGAMRRARLVFEDVVEQSLEGGVRLGYTLMRVYSGA